MAAATALLIGGLSVVLAVPAHADPAADERLPGLSEFIGPIVEEQLEEGDIPGAVVSVVSEGELVFAEGYGVADVESQTPVDPETTGFFTGSVSKLFIGQAVLQQVEAGALDLDADVNEYLTEFSIDAYPGRPVTLEHLLTHTSGFDERLDGLIRTDPEAVEPLGEWVADNQPARVREPGTVVAYDNYGTVLAAYVVEVVTGEDFADYVNDNILEPLGMTGTTLHVPHPDHVAEALATGYESDGTTVVAAQYAGGVPAGPGPVATAVDMAAWMIDQMAEDNHTAEQMRQTRYRQDERVGGGMGYLYENYERNGLDLSNKGGDIGGFHCDVVTIPEVETGIFVAYNGSGVDGAAAKGRADLVNQFLDRYFPAEEQPRGTVSAGTSDYAGEYRSSRDSRTSLSRVGALFASPVSVESVDDGTIVVANLPFTDGDVVWDQIEPGVFAERDGSGVVAFDDGVLSYNLAPMVAFEKQSWFESPSLHLILLLIALGVLLIGLVAYPVVAVVRKRRGLPTHPRVSIHG